MVKKVNKEFLSDISAIQRGRYLVTFGTRNVDERSLFAQSAPQRKIFLQLDFCSSKGRFSCKQLPQRKILFKQLPQRKIFVQAAPPKKDFRVITSPKIKIFVQAALQKERFLFKQSPKKDFCVSSSPK